MSCLLISPVKDINKKGVNITSSIKNIKETNEITAKFRITFALPLERALLLYTKTSTFINICAIII